MLDWQAATAHEMCVEKIYQFALEARSPNHRISQECRILIF